MAAKNEALTALPQHKKDMLRELTVRFNLDWGTAKIYTGLEGKAAIASFNKRAEKSEAAEMRLKEYALNSSRKAIRKDIEILPERITFNKGEHVCYKDDPDKLRYLVTDVEMLASGDVGYWCKIRGVFNEVNERGLIDMDKLEGCPVGV